MTVDALVTVGGGNKRKWNLMADVEGKGPIKTPPRSAHYTSTAWAATLLDLWPAVRILPSPKKSAAVLSEEIPSRWTRLCSTSVQPPLGLLQSQKRNGRPKAAWAPRQRPRRSSIRAPTA
jgi:hypothetical protein